MIVVEFSESIHFVFIMQGCKYCPGDSSHPGICVNSTASCQNIQKTQSLLISSRSPPESLDSESYLASDSLNKDLQYPEPSHNSCPDPYFWAIMTCVVLYLAAFSPGMGTVPWCVNAEIYPIEVTFLTDHLSPFKQNAKSQKPSTVYIGARNFLSHFNMHCA